MPEKLHQFYSWMDLFRFVAATVVVLSHARDILMVNYPGAKAFLPFYAATALGHSGVIVFFVLSGFWISQSVLRWFDRADFWVNYLIDRLSRLGIVLVPALLIGGVLDYWGSAVLHLPVYTGATGAHSLWQGIAGRLAPSVLIGNLLFMQTIAVSTWGSNGPLWSLAYEFWYYVWFPALVMLLARRRLSLGLLGLAVAWLNPDIGLGFFSWLSGAALSQALERRWQWGHSIAVRRALAAGAAALFLVVLAVTVLFKARLFDIPLAMAFALLLFGLSNGAVPVPPVLHPLARYGRYASFSLYMTHYPIMALIGGWLTIGGRMAPGLAPMLAVIGLTVVCQIIALGFATQTEARTASVRQQLKQWFASPLASEPA
jgi:peptidoglycan/LPS O-acetylase OafA/YrhL